MLFLLIIIALAPVLLKSIYARAALHTRVISICKVGLTSKLQHAQERLVKRLCMQPAQHLRAAIGLQSLFAAIQISRKHVCIRLHLSNYFIKLLSGD